MDYGRITVLTVVLGMTLLLFQRTVRKIRWLMLLTLVMPVIVVSYRNADYRNHIQEWQYALVLAAILNSAFWLLFGRNHPPGYQGEIRVLGIDDEE